MSIGEKAVMEWICSGGGGGLKAVTCIMDWNPRVSHVVGGVTLVVLVCRGGGNEWLL